MSIIIKALIFLIIISALLMLYSCIAVSKRTDNIQYYDERWIGKLHLTERYNQPTSNKIFNCNIDYKNNKTELFLVVNYSRPPEGDEKDRAVIIENAQVIELEGEYFWRDLSQQP